MKEGQPFTASLLFDSSPRNGREWMFGEAYIVKDIDLEAFVSLVDRMEAMRAGLSQQLRCDLSDEFEKMTEQLRRFMWHLVFPPACLGARNQGLAAKYAACLHKVRLLMGEWLFTQTFMRYVINLCTDVGTESDFALVPTIDGNQMFPQWDERRLVDDTDDSFMCPGWDSSALVSFAQALHSPGVEHCCHNVEKKLSHGLSFWKVFYKGAKEVAKLLHGKYYKQRFVLAVRVRGGNAAASEAFFVDVVRGALWVRCLVVKSRAPTPEGLRCLLSGDRIPEGAKVWRS
jgi:hypothetical protein